MQRTEPSQPTVSMPPEGIFVVHLYSDSAILDQRLHGRVEHVRSGDSQRFSSLSDLLAFMAGHADSSASPSDERTY